MIDFSFIGKDGIIIQYEDIVSMIGFNILRYFKLKGFESLKDYDLKQMILDYMNRDEEDYNKWVSDIIQTPIKLETYKDSVNAFQPSWLYVYKILFSAYKNGLNKLYIHSNENILFIQTDILPTFNIPSVKYLYGDIVPILNQNPNITYVTSLTSNIKKCLDVDVPFALTIVDDFLYTAPIIEDHIHEKLREKGVYVAFTGITSSGFIDAIK